MGQKGDGAGGREGRGRDAGDGREGREGKDGREQDLQLTLHVTYKGDASLTLTAQMVILDYPSPGFVNLPLRLKISGCDFDGVCLLAYLNNLRRGANADVTMGVGDEEEEEEEDGKGRINISFLPPEEAEAFLAGCADNDDEGVEGEGGRAGERKIRGDLLEDIRVESEIGDTHDGDGKGGQVLKNVGKVERFVLEQVRRIFEEEFVWPSWWCVLV